MKKILFCFLFAVTTSYCEAQIIVYKTYQNYLDKDGQVMNDDYFESYESTVRHSLIFKASSGKLSTFYPKEIWGLTCKDKIFRSVKGEIGMLVDTGRVNYWVNGFDALVSLIDPNNKVGNLSKYESDCYLSSGDINAKLYRMPIDILTMRDWNSFKKDFPDYEDLADCISFSKSNWNGNRKMIKDCVLASNKAYNKKQAKKQK